VRAIVAWLVAKPQNAILGLAGTLMLPFAQIVSGAVLVSLVLYQGTVKAGMSAIAAAALLAVIALFVNASPALVLANGLGTWLPVFILAGLMRYWRSVTLTLQVSVIFALLFMLAFHVVVADPIAFWKAVLTELAPEFAKMGMQQQAEILLTQQDLIAPQATIFVVFTSWSIVAGVLLLGYALMQMLPDQSHRFGRFCDLNFGRVLAIVMAVISLAAAATSIAWLQNVAFLMFAVFWIQGLAIAHWLRAEGRMPAILLVLVYVMLPLLNILMVVGLAIAGYMDAWFRFRRRAAVEN